MKEYVERSKVIDELKSAGAICDFGLYILEIISAANVEEVTRCRECNSCIDVNGTPYCTEWGKNTDEDGYCHKGG